MAPDPWREVSVFDGIGGSWAASEKAGLPRGQRFSSELDALANQSLRRNYPDLVHLGDVTKVSGYDPRLHGADLLIGGSPCQDLSCANPYSKGLGGERSRLFWDYVRLRDEMQPKWWLLENVVPRNSDDLKRMSEALGTDPRLIDSAEYSPSHRKRMYWTNIPEAPFLGQPRTAWDVLPEGPTGPELLPHQLDYMFRPMNDSRRSTAYDKHTARLWRDPKFNTLVKSAEKGVPHNTYQLTEGGPLYFLSPEEASTAMGYRPDYLYPHFSKSATMRMLGNSFDVDTVAQILRGIPLAELWTPPQGRERITLHNAGGSPMPLPPFPLEPEGDNPFDRWDGLKNLMPKESSREGLNHRPSPLNTDPSGHWEVFGRDPDIMQTMRKLIAGQGPFGAPTPTGDPEERALSLLRPPEPWQESGRWERGWDSFGNELSRGGGYPTTPKPMNPEKLWQSLGFSMGDATEPQGIEKLARLGDYSLNQGEWAPSTQKRPPSNVPEQLRPQDIEEMWRDTRGVEPWWQDVIVRGSRYTEDDPFGLVGLHSLDEPPPESHRYTLQTPEHGQTPKPEFLPEGEPPATSWFPGRTVAPMKPTFTAEEEGRLLSGHEAYTQGGAPRRVGYFFPHEPRASNPATLQGEELISMPGKETLPIYGFGLGGETPKDWGPGLSVPETMRYMYPGGARQVSGRSNLPGMLAEQAVDAFRNPVKNTVGLGAASALESLAQDAMRTGKLDPGKALRSGAEGTAMGLAWRAPEMLASRAPALAKLASAMPAVGGALQGWSSVDPLTQQYLGREASTGEKGLGALLLALGAMVPGGAAAEAGGALGSIPLNLLAEWAYSRPDDVLSDQVKARMGRR